MNSKVAIIPARGGSKRIPRKNIKIFCDRPIIEYPIQTALNSRLFDEVMVSTDDKEIAEISVQAGASVPFMRSLKTSSDSAPTAEALIEVLESYQERGSCFDHICCIYPTSPLVSEQNLIESYDIFSKKGADSLVPIAKYESPIQRSFKINNQGNIVMNWPKYLHARSQKLEDNFHDVFQFYWLDAEKLMSNKQLIMDNSIPYLVPEKSFHDINWPEDWYACERLFKERNS